MLCEFLFTHATTTATANTHTHTHTYNHTTTCVEAVKLEAWTETEAET